MTEMVTKEQLSNPELVESAWIELVKYNRERAGIAEDRVKVLEAERDHWKLEAIRLRGIITNASDILG